MSESRRRSHLAAIVVILLSFVGTAAGTWASFSASTANDGGFASGTLLLSDSVNAATACLSTASGTITSNDNDCDALFSATVRKPGDTATADLDVKSEGSITGDLSAYVASCADGDGAETYHGTASACGAVQLTVQEFASSALRSGGDVTGGNCRVGLTTGTGVTCAYGPTVTDFVATHASFTSALGLGAMTPSTTRYFRIGVKLPTSAGNDVQGRTATLGFTWRLEQS